MQTFVIILFEQETQNLLNILIELLNHVIWKITVTEIIYVLIQMQSIFSSVYLPVI